MLIVHHLGRSQSERIVWLCEELGLSYELKRYDRDPKTMLAPPEYKALHPLGAAPVMTDGDIVLAESGAIVEYLITKHGGGRLALPPAHPDYAQYVYWFHFANSTLQPVMGRNLVLARAKLPADNPVLLWTKARQELALNFLDARLRDLDYLAGRELTAADIMIVFSLTTMRYFLPADLTPYPHVLQYLRRIGEREAYRRAMRKSDPDMAPLLT
ncbi:MAG TPA: glutathione S-transferase family protein [Ramlibacter sp.]|nr:glutathione S-transferase family protein [Ramlibacter sp.]